MKKNHKKIIVAILLTLSVLWPTRPLWASPDSLRYLSYRIRQEQLSQNGVLVLRPHPTDAFVANFLYQNNIRNLEEYHNWLNQNLNYQTTPEKTWPSPQKTISKRGGDCKDFASLNEAVLRVLGYQPHVLAVTKNPRAHAICAFQADGYYLWFDNQRLVKTKTTSYPEFIAQLRKDTSAVQLSELDLQTFQWQIVKSPS